MRVLLDTHTLIWALSEPEKLGAKVIELLIDTKTVIFVSTASLWELQIKKSLGKIILPERFSLQLEESGYDLLSITSKHILSLENIPLLHKDPFDRMLIAQSLAESLPMITKDEEILKYDINTISF